ncbi:MAG: hypothetical protein ACKOFW_11760 [Planctomycetaceae bacterium]
MSESHVNPLPSPSVGEPRVEGPTPETPSNFPPATVPNAGTGRSRPERARGTPGVEGQARAPGVKRRQGRKRGRGGTGIDMVEEVAVPRATRPPGDELAACPAPSGGRPADPGSLSGVQELNGRNALAANELAASELNGESLPADGVVADRAVGAPRPKPEDLRAALDATGGMPLLASRRLGVSRGWMLRELTRQPGLLLYCQRCRQELFEWMAMSLREAVAAGKSWAVLYVARSEPGRMVLSDAVLAPGGGDEGRAVPGIVQELLAHEDFLEYCRSHPRTGDAGPLRADRLPGKVVAGPPPAGN